MADGLDFVPDVDMVDLSRCWLKPEDRELWDAAQDIAASSINCNMNSAIQAYIRTLGGPPTAKEVERHEEQKLADERKQWDEEFSVSDSGSDKALDELRRLRQEALKIKNGK